MIMLALIALLVLGGGGGGAYFFFFKKPVEAAGTQVAEHEEGADHGKEAGGHGEDGAQSHAQFVKLDPLILPVIDEYGVSQTISLIIAIEVEDEKQALNVRQYEPRLKDAFIQDMYGALSTQSALQNGAIKTSYIKARLNRVTQNVLGEGQTRDVLLQVVQQRPL